MTSPEGLTTKELLARLNDGDTKGPLIAELKRRIDHMYMEAQESAASRDRFASTARERDSEVSRLEDEVATLNDRIDTLFRILDRLVT